MKIPGTGQELLKAFTKILNNEKTSSDKQVRESRSEDISYYAEALHVDLSLTDGTTVSIDYIYEALAKKTTYEISAFSDYSYEDDYFSSENTAQRILDYARSLFDGSQERFDLLSNAIEKGIGEAKEILGDMPEWLDTLIGSTIDLIHEGLKDMELEITVDS
ncbi:MAG: DUF5610 domain-containing protein [Deltaproteobacteria bacterium]|nr:DUF5610 domain-containing protein [Deltaproteobacteria bacterium]